VQDVSNVLKNRLYNRKWKRGKEVKEIFVWFNREIFLFIQNILFQGIFPLL
jgi:hypothetical protein